MSDTINISVAEVSEAIEVTVTENVDAIAVNVSETAEAIEVTVADDGTTERGKAGYIRYIDDDYSQVIPANVRTKLLIGPAEGGQENLPSAYDGHNFFDLANSRFVPPVSSEGGVMRIRLNLDALSTVADNDMTLDMQVTGFFILDRDTNKPIADSGVLTPIDGNFEFFIGSTFIDVNAEFFCTARSQVTLSNLALVIFTEL